MGRRWATGGGRCIAACLLLAGCGSAGGRAVSGHVRDDATLASEVGLRAEDVGGWRESEPAATLRTGGREESAARCEGLSSRAREASRVRSPVFSGAQASAWSETRVVATAGEAARASALELGRRATGCFGVREYETTSEAPSGRRFDETIRETAHEMPRPAAIPGGREMQSTLVYGPPFDSSAPQSVIDTIGFSVGRVDIRVDVRSVEPLPATDRQIALLVYRHAARVLGQ